MAAGTLTWKYDITDNVMLNHTLSKDIRRASIAECVIFQHARIEPGYGKKKGESVTIQRVRALTEPDTAVIGEEDDIPLDEFAISTRTIVPEELGRALKYTDLMNELNNFDIEQPIQQALKDQQKLCLDTLAAAALKRAYVCFIPTSDTGGTWDVEAIPRTQATANLTAEHCGLIRDELFGKYLAPMIGGDHYVGLGSTKALRGIKESPLFVTWMQYLQKGMVLYRSEVGTIENIRWVEVNHSKALSGQGSFGGVGLNSVLGEFIVFGKDAIACAEVITPHLRAELAAKFGRLKAIAWYGMLRIEPVWNNANVGETNIVRGTSS